MEVKVKSGVWKIFLVIWLGNNLSKNPI